MHLFLCMSFSRHTKSSAPGHDASNYGMLKHLHITMQELVLVFSSRIWFRGYIPVIWRMGTVILLLKPGKDPLSPSSFCPVTLTSCFGKLPERMVNAEEQRGMMTDSTPCAYRGIKGRSGKLGVFQTPNSVYALCFKCVYLLTWHVFCCHFIRPARAGVSTVT